MKIAVCITGHIRQSVNSFPNSIPIFKFIEDVKKHNLDISYFASTWGSNGHNIGLHDSDKDLVDYSILNDIDNCVYQIDDDTLHDEYIDSITHKYSNVFKGHEPEIPSHHIQKYQIISMFNKINKCYNLINGKFDIILRVRFDCGFNIDTFMDIINKIEENHIYIPSEYEFGGDDAQGGGRINDIMAIGSYESMKVYMNTFKWIESDDCVEYMINNSLWFCPHTILRHQLMRNGISYSREKFDCRVYRKNGSTL